MIKSFIATASAALALTACGSQMATDAATVQAASTTTEGVLTNVTVRSSNGGINPDYFALVITGDVVVAGNSCEAQNITATLEQATVNGVVTVRAALTRVEPTVPVMCPRIWMPVSKTLSLTVRGSHSSIQKIQIKNMNELGTLVDTTDLSVSRSLVLNNVTATPVNAGINPSAQATLIKATVEGGSNPCVAASNRIEFVEKKIGNVIYVSAERLPPSSRTVCTAEYNPVMKEISLIVRTNANDNTTIIVRNVETIGHDVAASAL